jgi:hypothetical protein
MAAFVSNSALIGALVAIFLIAYLLYGNLSVAYVYMMSIWPWMAIATVIARLHIGRDRELFHFSPLIHLPLLGILGSVSSIGTLIALKDMTVIDCIVLGNVDPIFTGIFHGAFIGRIPYFTRYTRVYLFMIGIVFLYIYGQAYSGGVVRTYLDSVSFIVSTGSLSVSTYMIFFASRAAYILKCVYLKYSFIPTEKNQTQEFKSLFPNFPFPIRFRLDAVFDSGLMEDFNHGLGPTGTRDIFMLTDNLYLLPLASIASWIVDYSINGTLLSGLSPGGAMSGAPPVGIAYFLVLLLVLSVLLTPTATARILFDRGSSPHEWSGTPVFIAIVFACFDLLYTNPFISRFQIVCLAALLGLWLNYRMDLWLDFKKRYFLGSLKELEFLQPSCVREAQRQTLMDAVDKTSTDDFGTILLETAVHHGSNIKGYLNDDEQLSKRVWDPNPAARAAWKLAGSLVMRAIRERKARLGIITKKKEEDRRYMASVVQTFIHRVGTKPIVN